MTPQRRARRRHVDAFLILLPTLAAIAAGACATPGARGWAADRRHVTLHVVNRGLSDVVVYLADGSVPHRLGRVASLTRARLAIPDRGAALSVGLLVRADDSGRWLEVTPVVPGAGGIVELTIQPVLDASELSILAYGTLDP